MENKLTMKSLSEMLGEAEATQITFPDGHPLAGVTLNVRKFLPMNEAMGFVKDVVESCVDMNKAEYTPEAYDLALRGFTIARYAGIKFGKSDTSKVFRLVYETDIYEAVADVIDAEQYASLLNAIEERIEYNRGMLISTAAKKAMELLNQLTEFAGAASTMTEQMKSLDLEGVLDSVIAGMADGATKINNAAISPAASQDSGESKVIQIQKKKKE